MITLPKTNSTRRFTQTTPTIDIATAFFTMNRAILFTGDLREVLYLVVDVRLQYPNGA